MFSAFIRINCNLKKLIDKFYTSNYRYLNKSVLVGNSYNLSK